MNGSIAGEAICASLILLAGILGYVLGARRRPPRRTRVQFRGPRHRR
jgi:hypothetical protein